MPLINCPECANECSDKAATCPKCGCPLEEQYIEDVGEDSSSKEIVAGGLAVVVIVAALVWWFWPSGEEYVVEPPPVDKRNIFAILNDSTSPNNPLKRFRAEDMTLQEVLDRVGPFSDHQTISLDCQGGYNKTPPLYVQAFDIVYGDDRPVLLWAKIPDPLKATMHDVCMHMAREHLESLRRRNSEDLKYFRRQQ